MWYRIALGLMVGFVVHTGSASPAQGQQIFNSPSAEFYVNRTRGRDRLNVGLESIVRRDLNRGNATPQRVQPTFLQNNRGGGGGFGGSAGLQVQKPFADASHRPTVSPYLNLLRDDLTDTTIPNYHTLVRPQLEQNRFQQNQQRRNDLVYRQLQQIQAQSGFSPQGSEAMAPTGHATTYLYYSPYYPGLGGGRRR